MMQKRTGYLAIASVAVVLLLIAVMLMAASSVVFAQSGATLTPTPTPVVASPTPAIPHGLPIPSQAVVGRVLSATLVYWRPSADAVVPLVLPAGKTAWVLGVDTSGHYYKIIWADKYLWVPVETMGPNYDEVWHGAPLPTEVVE